MFQQEVEEIIEKENKRRMKKDGKETERKKKEIAKQ